MSGKTEYFGFRVAKDTREEVEQIAKANDLTPSDIHRLGLDLVLAKARAEGGVIAEKALSSHELRQKHAADEATLSAVLHPILASFGCENRYHRGYIIAELISNDRSLPARITQSCDLGVDPSEFLTALVADFFDREPNAAIWPVLRQQLFYLERQWGASKDWAHVTASIDRLDDRGRWLRMRHLMKVAAESGISVGDVWRLDENGQWVIPEMPYFKKATIVEKGRGTERIYQETSEPPNPVSLGEQMCINTVLRSPKIGAKTPGAKVRNHIGGGPRK